MSTFLFNFLFHLPSAFAIIIRHDVDDSEYVVADTDYPELFDLYGVGDCIGTLITSSQASILRVRSFEKANKQFS